MNPPSLLDRLRQARLVRVLVVYLGASWAVLQMVDVLMSMLSLPRWVGPVAVVLLLVGMVVILATAWVQSQPSTSAREAAGEVPTDWQIAPAEVLASLRRGRLPHLNWGRALLGGVVALSLLIGGAGAWVLITGREGLLGPAPLEAGEAAAGVAVVPFEVQGQDLEVWREGMVDLLSTSLDGLGGFRAIDSRTVLARWHGSVSGDQTIPLEDALRVAAATGARYAVVGGAVSLGGQVRLSADVYDLADGSKLDQTRVEGEPGDVLKLADRLAVDVTRILLGSEGASLVSESQVQSLSTHSLEALRNYLAGERLYRQGEFERAASAYEEAVARDSTFASAYYRLTQAYGWMEAGGDNVERAELALRALRNDLPPRDRLLLEGEEALSRGDPAGTTLMEEAVKRYPDDPDAWVLLGEFYVHLGNRVLRTDEDIRRVHAAAVELDPTFAPTYIHYAENAMHRGQPDEARRLLDTYVQQAPATHQGVALSLGWDLQFGDDASRAGAVAALDTLAPHTGADLSNGLAFTPAGRDALIELSDALWRRTHGPRWGITRVLARSDRGRLAEATAMLAELDGTPSGRYVRFVHDVLLGGSSASRPGPLSGECAQNPPCLLVSGMWSADAGDDAGAARARAALTAGAESAEGAARESFTVFSRALDAYRAARAGESGAALQELIAVQVLPPLRGDIAALLRLRIAALLGAQGNTSEALRYFESVQSHAGLASYAVIEEARLRAADGGGQEARAAYRRFLDLWSGAPADHALMKEAAAAVDAGTASS